MKIKEKEIQKNAPRLVNEALNQFELLKDTPEDIIDENGEDYCVNLGGIADYDQGDTDKDALGNIDEYLEGVEEETKESEEESEDESEDLELYKDLVEEGTDLISSALNETPEAKNEDVQFDFMIDESHVHQMRACMTKEAFKKKFGKGNGKKAKK
jgi:predicted RNase H-like HicB family nuclease